MDLDPLEMVLLPFQVMINKVYNPGIVGGGGGGVFLVVTRYDFWGMGGGGRSLEMLKVRSAYLSQWQDQPLGVALSS